MNNTYEINLNDNDTLDLSINEPNNLSFDMLSEIINIGTNNYNQLINKPSINDIELIGNKTLDNLGIQEKGNYANTRVTNLEIDSLFN